MSQTPNSVSPETLILQYPMIAANAERMCREVTRQIEELINSKSYRLGFPVQYRVKTQDSILDKIKSGIIKIKKLEDMQDIAGMRITLLFSRDIESLLNDISEIFDITKQYNTSDRLGDDQFGYSSVHLVIKIKKEWLSLPSFRNLDETLLEIQIRTLSQHTWAASSHALQYKNVTSAPRELRRSINRIAALLEMVDLELERLLNEQSTYIENISPENVEDLNVDTLKSILDELYPADNKGIDEQYEALLEELRLTDIDNTSKLRDFINRTIDFAKEKDLEAVKTAKTRLKKNPQVNTGGDTERIKKGVFYLHTGLLRISLVDTYGEEIQSLINSRPITTYDDLILVPEDLVSPEPKPKKTRTKKLSAKTD